MKLLKIISLVASMLLLVGVADALWQAKPPVEVPFEFVHNQIVVQVKIDGKGPFNLLLDTNTDPSAIDAATARELGLQIGTKGATASGGGTEANTIYPTRLSTVELGSVIAKDVLAATIDLTKIGNRIGKPIQGVLGYSFLKDRIVQIDYPNSKLRFYSESPYPKIQFAPNTVNAVAFPLRREDGSVVVEPVFINGEKMKAALDTGSSGTFALTPEAVVTLKLGDDARDATDSSVGYNGEYEHKVGILKSVRLGRVVIDSAQATFWLPKTGHDNRPFQVNIGNGFLQDCVVTFDFRNKIVVLEKVE